MSGSAKLATWTLLVGLAVGCGEAGDQPPMPLGAQPRDTDQEPDALASQALARALRSPDAVARMGAAKRAGAMGAAAARLVPDLERMAQTDEDADVRRVAGNALRHLRAALRPPEPDPDAMTVAGLLADLRRDDPLVRLRSAKELGRVAVRSTPVLAALEAAANEDPDDDVRAVARRSFEQLSDEAGRGTPHAERRGNHVPPVPGPEPAPPPRPAPPPPPDPQPDPQPAPPPAPAPSLVGTWSGSVVVNNMSLQLQFRFRADGTFRLESETDTGVRTVLNGTYKCRDDVVTTVGNGGGRVERATVDWIDKDSFTYLGGGVQVSFRRMR